MYTINFKNGRTKEIAENNIDKLLVSMVTSGIALDNVKCVTCKVYIDTGEYGRLTEVIKSEKRRWGNKRPRNRKRHNRHSGV